LQLQIIKNSDLEELRELGSGTFGTVYHGKWRGSDVAIKRISDRCFAGRTSEEHRMVCVKYTAASFQLSIDLVLTPPCACRKRIFGMKLASLPPCTIQMSYLSTVLFWMDQVDLLLPSRSTWLMVRFDKHCKDMQSMPSVQCK
jgi:hypothetical protein